MIRKRTDANELRTVLQSYYTGNNNEILIEELSHFLSTIVQNDKCMLAKKNTNETQKLQELLCSTSLTFVPHPVTEKELEQNGLLINGRKPLASGTYGRVYEQVMDNQTIVVKTPLTFREDTIRELYVQYVIINTILLYKKITNHLIPYYGFFICSSDVDEIHSKDKTHPITICKKSGGGLLHTIQHKIDGVPLLTYLRTSNYSFYIYRTIMKELFLTLISLESSPYCIHHNDLHTSNVMVANHHPVLLDWGLTSFITKETAFCPSKEHRYHSEANLHTGACDAYLLFYGMLYHIVKSSSESSEHIVKDLLIVITKLSQLFYEEKNEKIQPLEMQLQQYVHSFENKLVHNGKHLFEIKERLSFYVILHDLEEHTSTEENRTKIHELHVEQLRKTTYATISRMFEPPLVTEREIVTAQELLQTL